MKTRLGLAAIPIIALAWTSTVFAETDHGPVNEVLDDQVNKPAYVSDNDSMQANQQISGDVSFHLDCAVSAMAIRHR